MRVDVGAVAPEFRLRNQNDQWVGLRELLARGPVLVAFYPGDFTPVCTRQLCSYQDAFERFENYGIQVVGISANSPEEHRKFKARYGFGFDLLSDPDKAVARAYQISSIWLLGGISRAVFVIDRAGKVLYRHVEPTPITHRRPGQLLAVLDALRAGGRI